MRHSHSRRLALLATAPVLALALAGCGGSSSTEQPEHRGWRLLEAGGPRDQGRRPGRQGPPGDRLRRQDHRGHRRDVRTQRVPRRRTARRSIGFDIDLFDAVAAKLGLKASFAPTPFGSIIPGIGSGKYEIGVSSFTINSEREKQANMVSYFSAGTQWATKKGNPAKVDPNDACGAKVAVQKATVQVDDITARSDEVHVGRQARDPDRPVPGPGPGHRGRRVGQGRGDARRLPGDGLRRQPDQGAAASCSARSTTRRPTAYVVAKEETAFAEAVRDAVSALIADGTLQEGPRHVARRGRRDRRRRRSTRRPLSSRSPR